MLQLDALRAFAVLAVLFSHFTLYTRMVQGVIQVVDLAGFGVRLFFVLSGFLITGILLRSKSYCEKSGSSIWYELRQCYVRRFLRIFPLFYFVLVLATVLGIPPVRETWLSHFSYLQTFACSHTGGTGQSIIPVTRRRRAILLSLALGYSVGEPAESVCDDCGDDGYRSHLPSPLRSLHWQRSDADFAV